MHEDLFQVWALTIAVPALEEIFLHYYKMEGAET